MKRNPRAPARLAMAFLACLAAAADGRAQTAAWDDALVDFGTTLQSDVDADGVGGIAAGVVVDGDLIWARGFGWADRELRTPMGPSAVLRTGSISKSVTAMLMMRLVDQGVVSLDDPVTRYLPEFGQVADRRPGTPEVTLRHLASHTAGIVREPDLEGAASGPISGWEAKVVESLHYTRFDSIAGARYQYSNIGFGALGLALSRAAGRPFMDLVRDEIFTPLGMTGSTFILGDLEPRLAAGYVHRRDGTIDPGPPAREHAGRGYKVPNGGVYSTVADLGRFLGALSGVPGLTVLLEESRREMIRVQTPESPDQGYGLGLSILASPDGRRYVAHGGSVAGYNAFMIVDPEARVGVVLLRNYTGGVTNLGRTAGILLNRLVSDRR